MGGLGLPADRTKGLVVGGLTTLPTTGGMLGDDANPSVYIPEHYKGQAVFL